jgi:hypothetical protein
MAVFLEGNRQKLCHSIKNNKKAVYKKKMAKTELIQ